MKQLKKANTISGDEASQILIAIPKGDLDKLGSESEKKQFLGNYLYQFVLRKVNVEALAGRITGMILDGQTIDYILYLCQNKKEFFNIVDEAQSLIKKAEQTQVAL